VVKPAPLSAERAWKRADSCDIPVETRIAVATRVTSSEIRTITRTETSATIAILAFPPLHRVTRAAYGRINGANPPGKGSDMTATQAIRAIVVAALVVLAVLAAPASAMVA
jgi:hypothetical protein